MGVAQAKKLRGNMTDAERRLWYRLRGHRFDGHKFKRQVPVGRYVVDFACLGRKLVVEVDGGQHADNQRDAVRDSYLQNEGFRVLRFWNNDILTNLDGVAEAIAKELSTPHPARASRESPSPSRGEGIGAPNA